MSSVLQRKRGICNMAFYQKATEVRTVVTKAVMNENIVPKRWRPVFAFPTLQILIDMFGHIHSANNTFAYTPELLAERRRYQQYAINDVHRLDNQLEYLLETLYYGKIDADHPIPAMIENAGNLIDELETILVGWRKSSKLLTNKK